MGDTWVLRLTGAAQLCVGPRQMALDGLAAVMAARLVLEGPQPRALLAGLLWPDAEPARARANLRQRLLRLKQQAGADWISGSHTLALAGHVTVEPTDEPWAPDLLQGVTLDAQDELSRWLDQVREQQRQRRLAALQAAAQAAEAEQRWPEAIDCVQRQLGIEPLSEDGHRALIRLHYLAGDTARAHVAFGTLQALLRREFGLAPGAQTLALMQLVQQARPVPALALATGVRHAVALLRPPRLVGRSRELGALRAAIEQRQALLLLGEAGMGKSRLLNEALRGVGGTTGVALVKAQAGDGGVPYSTLARLLRPLLSSAPNLPMNPPRPGVLAWVLPEITAAGLPLPVESERLALLDAVRQLLAGAGLQAVAVDDLHFADAATLDLLAALASDETSGLAWLFTQRPGEGPAAARALCDALEEGRRLHRLALAPLDAAQVLELVQDLQLPGVEPAPLAARLHRHAGGNPLFLLETLKQLLTSGDGDGGDRRDFPQPASVGALIDRRLRSLSDGALALARAAAIAGPDFDPPLAEAVLGRRAIELADAWAELEAAQVIRDSAFAHDLVLDAALRSIPAAIAAHLHAAVAAHLEAVQGAPARIAAHWRDAGQPARAWPWFERAADRACDQLRPREERQFIESAVALHEQLGQRGQACQLLCRLYRAQIDTRGFADAEATLDRAEALAPDDHQRAQIAVYRSMSLEITQRYAEAERILAPAVAVALDGSDEALAVTALTCLARMLAMQGRGDEAQQWLDRHWALAQRSSTYEMQLALARVLESKGQVRDAWPLHRQATDIALASAYPADAMVMLGNLANNRLKAGVPGEGSGPLDELEALLRRHDGLSSAASGLHRLRGAIEREQSRFADALAHFERALALPSAGIGHGIVRVERSVLWLAIGQHARAMQDLAQGLAGGLTGFWAVRAHQLQAMLALQMGQDAQPALDAAQAAAQPWVERVQGDMLELLSLRVAAGPGQTPDPAALARTEAVCLGAAADGLNSVLWHGRWVQTQLALRLGDETVLRQSLQHCLQRPDAERPRDLSLGLWWHGLWRAALRLGDAGIAEMTRAEGLAWLHRTLRSVLPTEFHRGFRDAVPAHQALLAG